MWENHSTPNGLTGAKSNGQEWFHSHIATKIKEREGFSKFLKTECVLPIKNRTCRNEVSHQNKFRKTTSVKFNKRKIILLLRIGEVVVIW